MNRLFKSSLPWLIATIVAVLVLVFWVYRNQTVTVDSGSRVVMGTLARVVVVADNEKQGSEAIEKAFHKIEDIEKLMSDYDPNSQLSYVNQHAFREPVKVDDSLFEVLSASLEYSRLSQGAFDVTIGPLSQLWRIERQTGRASDPQAVAKAHQAVGWENLILDPANKTVRFAKEGMQLDLGGIAKGYAVDKAVEIIRDGGLAGGMADIGGNLRCFGKPANGAAHWRIGLQDPRNDQNILMTLIMDDMSVATSGDYQRFAVVDGKTLSHILDPHTAKSSQNLSSVTIIAPSAMQADALSTSVTILEEQKGLLLIDSLKGTEAILIKDGQLIKSKKADQYIDTSHNNQ